MPRLFWETYDDHCEILPTLTIGAVKCDRCDVDHGFAISVAWLFWAAGIAFISEDQ
jgi:hypothetical protein